LILICPCVYYRSDPILRWLYFMYLNCNTGGASYMRSFYLRFRVYAIQKWPFSGTHPLIYSHPWSFYMWICYMQAYFFGVPTPYLSHITRSTCTLEWSNLFSDICRAQRSRRPTADRTELEPESDFHLIRFIGRMSKTENSQTRRKLSIPWRLAQGLVDQEHRFNFVSGREYVQWKTVIRFRRTWGLPESLYSS